MHFLVVLGGAFALLCVVFALQNNVTTTVTFFLWRFDSTLAIVLLVAFIAGALIAVLFTVPAALRARLNSRRQRRQIAALNDELAALRRRDSATNSNTDSKAGTGTAALRQLPLEAGHIDTAS